jgi:hypothetical protein
MSICSTGLSDHEAPRSGGKGASIHDPGKPLTVSVKRARELLDISHTTVWGLISEKRLDTVKLGSKRLVIFASIEQLIAELQQAAKQEAA